MKTLTADDINAWFFEQINEYLEKWGRLVAGNVIEYSQYNIQDCFPGTDMSSLDENATTSEAVRLINGILMSDNKFRSGQVTSYFDKKGISICCDIYLSTWRPS